MLKYVLHAAMKFRFFDFLKLASISISLLFVVSYKWNLLDKAHAKKKTKELTISNNQHFNFYDHSKGSVIFNDQEKSCSNNNIWLKLNRHAYFKRTSAFYLIDMNIIKLYYVSNAFNNNYNITFQIALDTRSQKNFEFDVLDSAIKISLQTSVGHFRARVLNIYFNLREEFLKLNQTIEEVEKMSIFLIGYEANKKYKIDTPLEAEIKRFELDQSSNESILCSKCLFLEKKSDYDDLRWWLDINYHIGYSKVSFCSNEIDLKSLLTSHNKYSDNSSLSFDYSRFLEVESLDCFPNFFTDNENSKDEFIRSLKKLGYRGAFSNLMTDIFNVIITNSCYIRNFNKFSHIMVADNDETVIPRAQVTTYEPDYFQTLADLVNSSMIYEDIKNEIEKRFKCVDLRKYLNELFLMYKSRKNQVLSYYFQQAYYLDMNLMQKLMEKLEKVIYGIENPYNTLVNVEGNYSNSSSFNYTFLIQDESSLIYVKNLLLFNNYFVRPYLNRVSNMTQKLSDNYNRFYFLLSQRDNQYASGKTIHVTRFNNTRIIEKNNVCVHSLCQRRATLVHVKHGFLSHFRKSVRFDMKKENQKNLMFNVRQLMFDFNYLNCFVNPILAKYNLRTG